MYEPLLFTAWTLLTCCFVVSRHWHCLGRSCERLQVHHRYLRKDEPRKGRSQKNRKTWSFPKKIVPLVFWHDSDLSPGWRVAGPGRPGGAHSRCRQGEHPGLAHRARLQTPERNPRISCSGSGNNTPLSAWYLWSHFAFDRMIAFLRIPYSTDILPLLWQSWLKQKGPAPYRYGMRTPSFY